MRSALLALLLGGCLIVRTSEDTPVETPCPSVAPELLAEARGPFAIAGDTIYFIAANQTLSRVAVTGGTVSELTTTYVHASKMAADATDLYWADDNAIMRRALTGGLAYSLVEGEPNVTELLVDDRYVMWAGANGLAGWSKTAHNVSRIDIAPLVLGLGAYDGVYYYSDTHGSAVRRTLPVEKIADSLYPASLVVDEDGVYFFEATDTESGYAGRLRLVPRDGGEIVTLASRLNPVMDLTADDTNLYFVATGGNAYRIQQVPRAGGALHTLACGDTDRDPVFIANQGSFVYWADGRGLYRVEKAEILD